MRAEIPTPIDKHLITWGTLPSQLSKGRYQATYILRRAFHTTQCWIWVLHNTQVPVIRHKHYFVASSEIGLVLFWVNQAQGHVMDYVTAPL